MVDVSGPGALQLLAASTERSIAIVLMAIVVIGWAIYVFVNIRQAKAEAGSEIELAPNRGVMPDDEELEGRRLEKVQAFGVLMLLIMALVLPVYWMLEGGRRSGAETAFSEAAENRGEALAAEQECTDCHGADLGGARFAPVVLDIGHQFSDKESYVINTTWEAPSLDDVFTRFDTDAETLDEVSEVRQILVYGRGVMPAWGLDGGGPLNDQEIDDLVAWLWRERLSDEEAQERAGRASLSSWPRTPTGPKVQSCSICTARAVTRLAGQGVVRRSFRITAERSRYCPVPTVPVATVRPSTA